MPNDTLILGSASVLIEAGADSTRTPRVTITAYSGGVISPAGWPAVVIDVSGADVSSQIPLLAGHAEDLDAIVGQGNAVVRDGKILVDGVITSATTAGQKVLDLSRGGIKLQASVGYVPDQREHIPAGQTVAINGRTLTAGPDGLTIVRSGRLREVSLLSIGADSETSVSISAALKRKKTMPNENINDFVVSPDEHTRLDAAAAMTPDGYIEAAEKRQRLIQCWDATPRLTTADGQRKGAELRASATRGELGLEQYRNQMADLMVAERPKGPAIHSSGHEANTPVLEAAFCRSAGLPSVEDHYSEQVLEAADKSFRGGLGLQEMLLRCAAEAGYSDRAAIRGGNLDKVLRAAFSTVSLPGLLGNVANKFLSAGFDSVEQVWRAVSRTRSVADFKTITSYRLTGDAVYEEVGASGELHHGTLGEESYTNEAKTYGRMFQLTRRDIINDDLGAFDSIRQRLGRGAALKLNEVFWTAFRDNATFFTAARGNLQEGASTLLAENGTALAAAEKLFLDLAGDGGHPLGVEPALLLVPTALGVTARKLHVSTEMRDTTASKAYQVANLFHDRFTPLVSAYLGANNSGGSDTGWYLVADPSNLPLMEVAFLDGLESPTVQSAEADFNVLGVQFRGFHDFGATTAEWRAGVKSDGTD